MKNKYLTEYERYQIEILLKNKTKIKDIAYLLNRSQSTIYREIKLGTVEMVDSNLKPYKKYCADRGQQIQEERSHNKGKDLKIGNDMDFVRFMEDMILNKKYSPCAILAYINNHNIQFKTKVCFKTIYNYISQGIFLNVNKSLLPMPRKNQKSSSGKKRIARNHINHRSIEKRPSDINNRLQYGHWEMDTVVSGRGDKICLFVFSERMTRQELIFKADSKSQDCLIKILNRLERSMGAVKFRDTFKTITCDNGTEFLDMDRIEKSAINKKLKRTTIYYCHPYNACERGTNENQNKLIRRWIPKGSNISEFTEQYIKDIEAWMNSYPRKIFNYLTSTDILHSVQTSELG